MSETPNSPNLLQRAINCIPEDLRRQWADAMSDMRADIGPELADRLRGTPPEERTWLDFAESGLRSSTDWWDGKLTADLPPSEDGRERDRRGDRDYVMPQQLALADNGEIPRVHYTLKVLREEGMKGLRLWGERNGKNLKSLQVGRAKTVAEMTHMAVAHSPLSQNEDLMRWGASIGTGLSLTSLFETAFQYMGDTDDKEITTARNSAAREASAGPLERLASLVDEKAPGITPSHVTKIGKSMVEGASGLIVVNPDKAALATAIYTVGSLLDAFDGSLARKKGTAGIEGMIEDVQADLEQQIATLGALSIVAMRRGNKVAAANYAMATMLTPLSAYTRAQAEAEGLIVAEGGMGTRVGRGIMGGIGMANNRRRNTSDIVSALLATSTANTVMERQDVVRNGANSKYCVGSNDDPAFREEARIRLDAIKPYAEAGLAIGGMLLAATGSDTIQSFVPKTASARSKAEAGTAETSDAAAVAAQ